MKIKICGMRQLDNVLDAISLGASAIGFIFAPSSPRYITPEEVAEIVHQLPPFVSIVGVFVDETVSEMNRIGDLCHLDFFQLHGSEGPEACEQLNRRVIKTIKVADLDDIESIAPFESVASAVLLDTKLPDMDGGTGKIFDWGIALAAKEKFDIPIILAGGISETNMKKAIQLVNPYAIDLSSSVELEPGVKSYDKMQAVLKLAQGT